MTELYDVAVVGAGPAGSVFARELSRLRPELSVILVDGQTEENKKPCGGLLAPDAQKALAEFDLTLPKDILSDPQIFTVETIDLASGCVRYYQRHYLNMDRYLFDRWLLSLVPSEVKVITDRVKDIRREESGFILSLSDSEIRANEIVGADGASSIVRRRMGIRLPKTYISVQEWFKHEGGLPYYSCIFDSKTSDSCSWTVGKDGYMIFGGALERKGCSDAFDEQKRRFEAFVGRSLGEPIKREACQVVSPRRPSDLCCGGIGFYLIGEAAGFISASSFEGISSAVTSAGILAESFVSGEATEILKNYKRGTRGLRLRLIAKMLKRAVLCSPFLRLLIMKSGIQSMKVNKNR